MLALLGHRSRAMLERYSHIRMRAKREAVAFSTSETAAEYGWGPHTLHHTRHLKRNLVACKLMKYLVSAVGIEPTT
jgi:hypothetical protein